MYNLSTDFNTLDSYKQSVCMPYAVWKGGFFCHIILFFLSLSFAVGTCDTFLNEEDSLVYEANQAPEREPTTKLLEKAVDVLRAHCILFCGPFILVECILSVCYYNAITEDCQPFIDDAMTSTMVYEVVVLGIISIAVTSYCTYMTILLAKAAKKALPSMRNAELWRAA